MSISWALDDAKRIVDWDDAGRLADDEWLVERNDAAIIAIARALLSISASERGLREALEKIAAPSRRQSTASEARPDGVSSCVEEEAMTSPAIPSPKGEADQLAEMIEWARQRLVRCSENPQWGANVERYALLGNMLEDLQARRSSSSREEVRREALERAFAEIEALNLGRRDTILRLRAALSQGE